MLTNQLNKLRIKTQWKYITQSYKRLCQTNWNDFPGTLNPLLFYPRYISDRRCVARVCINVACNFEILFHFNLLKRRKLSVLLLTQLKLT